MAAYIIAEVQVTDPSRYEEYRKLVGPILSAHGGRFLVRGGATTALEGEPWGRTVVLEFPDSVRARAFYNSPDYHDALKIRTSAARARLVLVEGV